MLVLVGSFRLNAQQSTQIYRNVRIHDNGNLSVFGDFLTSDIFTNNLGSAYFSGAIRQNIGTTQLLQFQNIVFDNASAINIRTLMQSNGLVTFRRGIEITPRATPSVSLQFLPSSTYIGASDTRHVNGYVSKIGRDSFMFPIGNGLSLRPAAALPQVSDTIKAAYYDSNPSFATLPLGAPFDIQLRAADLRRVSELEFWHIAGTENARITLTWNPASQLSTLLDNDISKLVVAGWDGTAWRNLGGETFSGNFQTGSVGSRVLSLDSFSVFTLAMAGSTQRCALPLLSILDSVSLCQGETLTLNAIAGYDTYEWRDTSGRILCANCRTFDLVASQNNVIVLNARTNNTVCNSLDTTYVSVRPTFTTNIDTTICDGQSVRFGTRTYTQAGTYRDVLLSSQGCDSILNITLRVSNRLQVSTLAATCFGKDDGQIVVAGNTTGFTAFINNISIPFSNLGRMSGGTYQVRIESALSGCSIDTTLQVEEPPFERITLGADTLHIPSGQQTLLTVTPIGNYRPISYEWQPTNLVECATCPNTRTNIVGRSDIRVVTVDDKGCRSETNIDILVDTRYCIYMPTAFRPEQENYTVLGCDRVRKVRSMRVFNRWGSLMFEAFNFVPNGSVFWDGTFRGQQLNTGTFVLMLELEMDNGETPVFATDILLTR